MISMTSFYAGTAPVIRAQSLSRTGGLSISENYLNGEQFSVQVIFSFLSGKQKRPRWAFFMYSALGLIRRRHHHRHLRQQLRFRVRQLAQLHQQSLQQLHLLAHHLLQQGQHLP